MKNILFLHSSSELYGSDRSLLSIVSKIDNSKYSIHVILPDDGPLADEIRKIKYVNLTIYPIAVLRRKNLSVKGGIDYLLSYYKSQNYIINYIKKHSIDLVETNTSVVFPGAVAAKKCGIKSIWHIREIIGNKWENKIISMVMNRNADIIIANSKATCESLKVAKSKKRVIYNAIEYTGKQEKIKHTGIIVGMAGRINRWKGQRLFVDAAKIVTKTHPDIKFWIAGDNYAGEEYIREDLINYIENSGMNNSVELLGRVEDMDCFYNTIDVFVLPSIQPEPFGLVIIEAMAHKVPVIATNHGAPLEIIRNDIDGFLVNYTDAQQMADRICELITDNSKHKSIGEEGHEKVMKQFTVDKMVEGLESIYNEIFDFEEKKSKIY